MNDTLFVDKLEEAFLAISDGDKQAIKRVREQLDSLPDPLPEPVQNAAADNLPLIVEDMDAVLKDEQLQGLMLDLAKLGVESMALRDAIAALCRQQHKSYPDPAGLIRAIGVLDEAVPVREVYDRWQRFELLFEGNHAWHDSFGLGKIVEIDGFSDLFVIQFTQKQSFSLTTCLTTLSLVQPDSLAARLLAEPPQAKPPSTSEEAFVEEILASFAPLPEATWPIVEAVLVPAFVRTRDFPAWRKKGQPVTKRKAQSDERTWEDSRSPEELKILLGGLTSITPTVEAIENLSRLYRFCATRLNFQEVMAETLSTLQELSGGEDQWLRQILDAMPDDTIVWTDPETFTKVTGSLPARLREAWFSISHEAKGQEWFIDHITRLPLKFWPAAETIIEPGSDEYQTLCQVVFDQVRRGDSIADAALWLWRLEDKQLRRAFHNPNSIFRILAQPAMGNFIKARKDLFGMLMDDSAFQETLMRGGTREAIGTFVRAIKTSTVLQKGEQQSLLVKIVRIYPDAKDIVEERQEAVARSPLPKLTSYRSMKERHDELQQIINKKIPENTAAIAHARSYGDLRENAEYKAAKDEQRLLMSRRGELEKALKEIQSTDFSDVVVGDVVVPGVSVVLEIEGSREQYHICGMWDSAPDRHVISYDTPLGRKLMGKRIGEELQVNEDRTGQILAIEELPDDIKEWLKLPE